MTIEVFRSGNMAYPFRSEWIETRQPAGRTGRKPAELNSIQISWREVSQLGQSSVEIRLSNDCETSVEAARFLVDCVSNETDAIVVFASPMFRFFSVAFAPQATMSGKLTVLAYFAEA